MRDMFEFKNKKIRDIRLWAWTAAVIPTTSLGLFFFIWFFGTDTAIDIFMTCAATVLFGAAIVWWWWVLYTIKILLATWHDTGVKVHSVIEDISEVKAIVEETFSINSDK